jgi:hypothetical protein
MNSRDKFFLGFLYFGALVLEKIIETVLLLLLWVPDRFVPRAPGFKDYLQADLEEYTGRGSWILWWISEGGECYFSNWQRWVDCSVLYYNNEPVEERFRAF